jgi:PKD repeat protein
MKTPLLIAFLVLNFLTSSAQSSYNSSNYAAVGDTFYMTNVNDFTLDFETTGANINWNFGALTGFSQDKIMFRNPSSTGFNFLTFPYIYIPGNTNLSSTNGNSNTVTTGGQTYGISDQNDYFKKSTASLKQVATSYKFNLNGLLLPITSQFDAQDTVYTFPFTMGTTNNSLSSYTTSIPSVLYQNTALDRTNLVDGWGTLITPYGTFTNALRMNTTLVQNDTISVAGTGLPRTIRTSRELKWFDASKKYPLLIVTQNSVGTNWVTSNVQFLDVQTDFQTNAFFFYTPLAPTAGATVNFQNLSTNATTYNWDFGDPSSADNTSALQNPEHIFANNGVYSVTLTASNSGFTNTVTQIVVVGDVLNVDNAGKEPFKIAPNPFKDKISVIGLEANTDYELYNFQGKLVYKGKSIENQDFSGLQKGVYLLKVKNNDLKKVIKLIKQ